MAQLKEHCTNADKVEKVIINDCDISVVVTPSPDERIYIRYLQKAGVSYEIQENDATLTVKKVKKWYAHLSLASLHKEQLMVFLPEQDYESILIKTTNGSINVESVFVKENVKLLTGNGNVTATLVKAGNDIIIKSRNGKIDMSSLSAQSRIVAKTANGKIAFEGCDAQRLFQCHTSNEDITGRMPLSAENYAIYSQTTNGKNNLPSEQEGPDKTMNMETSNGNIDVKF